MQKRNLIHALELGGTLFVPASHKSLAAILSGEKYPALRSVVIDFEDGLSSADRPEALAKLDEILAKLQETRLLRFIRPQNPQMLKALLAQRHIEKIDGFILSKFGLDNANDYLSIIQNIEFKINNFKVMPSIEGEELFDTQKLRQLRDILQPYQERIICIRFGAEDMLRQLGLRRTATSLYDMLAPSQVIANLISTFKPSGFDISAPVYPDFSSVEGFEREVQRELENGLISKTIIHPSQIEPMNELYKVSQRELEEAQAILTEEDGVLNLNGKMGEAKTQSISAYFVSLRNMIYGIS